MAGNGYYDRHQFMYLPKSVENWDNYDGSSAGGPSWDNWTEWRGTPVLPLEFTSPVFDAGEINYFNVTTDVEYEPIGNITFTLFYGNTVDSAGGDIDSPSSISWTPGGSVGAVEARFFQLKVAISEDSALLGLARLKKMSFNALQEYANETITDLVTSTLSGTVGQRTLSPATGFSQITSLICQAQTTESKYVADSYVASDDSAGEVYIEEGATPIPYVTVVSKGATPEIRIVDLATYGKEFVDATIDVRIEGLRSLTADATDGNVRTT